MERSEIEAIVRFVREAERLKDVTRTAWTSEGRRESVAEHSWRLCLLAMLVSRAYPALDVARLLKICVVHDLGEAIGGDVSAKLQTGPKAEEERAALEQLVAVLPPESRREVVALWDEYEAAATPEARLAKALDKIETIVQHNQGLNPPDFDYAFNLEYGRRWAVGDAVLEALRGIVDAETARRQAAGA